MDAEANLIVRIDGREIEVGKVSLDQLAAAAGRAEGAAGKLGRASKDVAQDMGALAREAAQVEARIDRLLASVDPLAAGVRRASAEIKEANTLFAAGAISAEQHARALQVLEARQRSLNGAQDLLGKSAKLTSAEMLNLSRQTADLAVSLAGGINPLMVLIQQGPQISETFQTAGQRGLGFGAVMKQLAGTIPITGVAIGGVVGTLAALGITANNAERDLLALDRVASGVGRTTGLTGEELNDLANRTAEAAQVSRTASADMASAYVATGRVGAENLSRLLLITKDFAAFTGKDVPNATEALSRAITGPTRAAEEYTRQFGLLTQAQIDQVRAAEDAGDANRALGIILGELGPAVDGHAGKVDEVTDAWRAMGNAISDAIDKFGEWLLVTSGERQQGRVNTLERQIQSRLTRADAIENGGFWDAARAGMSGLAAANPAARQQYAARLRRENAADERELAGIRFQQGYDRAAAANEAERARVNQRAQLREDRATAPRRERAARSGLSDAERDYNSVIEASRRYEEQLRRESETYGMNWEQLARYNTALQVAEVFKAAAADGTAELTDAEFELVAALQSSNEAMIARRRLMDGETLTNNADRSLRPAVDLIDDDSIITRLEDAAAKLREIDDIALGLGDSLSRSFGQAGQALGEVISTMTGYRSQVADLFELVENGEMKRADAVKQAARLEVQAYGDIAGSAKAMFDERSEGYRILQGVEAGFRAFELASSVAAIAQGWIETSQSVAQAATKGAADTAAGGAKIFSQLGMWAFPVVGAMLAVLGGLGGSGGSVSTPSLPTTNSGQGTVLGDPTAESASLANSLDRAERYQSKDLQFSDAMVKALRSIDDQIGSVTTAIARELGVGGGLNTSGLNLGTTTSGGFLGIGRTTTTTALADQGINISGGRLSDLIAQGVSGSLYQIVESTRTRSGFLGIGGSTRTSLNETTSGIDAGLSGEFGRLLASLRSGVLTAAGVVGVQGAEALLDGFNVEIGRISFDGLSSSEIRERLSAVFSAVGDDLAAAALPGIERFQRAGEGAFETLARLAAEYETVDDVLRSIGQTFRLVGVESIEARSRLIDLAGGLDALIEGTDAFSEAFLTEAQRIAPVQAAVTAELARLGIASDISRTQFADLVLGLDVSTEAGAQMYASLIRLAPALDSVISYQDELAASAADAARQLAEAAQAERDRAIEAANAAVDAARADLTQAYEREAGALRDTESRFLSFARSLSEFRRSLEIDNGIGGVGYGAARSRFNEVASLAALGNEQALGELQGVSQAYLEQSKAYSKDSLAYLKDLSAVKVALQRAESTATRTASNAQLQLAALDASVAGLITLNTSVLSVRDAIIRLQAALTNQSALSVSSTGYGLAAGQAGNVEGRDYGNPFNRYVASQTGYGGSFEAGAFEAWIAGQSIAIRNAARQAYANFDMIPGFATGGSFTVGGSGGTDSQLMQFRATPGEMVNVTRPGANDNGELVSEIRALRQEVAQLRAAQNRTATASEKTATTLVRVTRDGDAMLTEAA